MVIEYSSRKSSEWRRGSSHQVRQSQVSSLLGSTQDRVNEFWKCWMRHFAPKKFITREQVVPSQRKCSSWWILNTVFNYLSAETLLTLRDAGKKVRWLLFKSKIFVLQLTFSICHWSRIQDTKLTSHSRVWNTNCKLILISHRFNRNWFVQ